MIQQLYINKIPADARHDTTVVIRRAIIIISYMFAHPQRRLRRTPRRHTRRERGRKNSGRLFAVSLRLVLARVSRLLSRRKMLLPVSFNSLVRATSLRASSRTAGYTHIFCVQGQAELAGTATRVDNSSSPHGWSSHVEKALAYTTCK